MQTKRERSWVMIIFGLIFFCAGTAFFALMVLPALHDGARMQSWNSTKGSLLGASLDTSHVDQSTTYTAKARYQYHVDGKSYENNRVAIHTGGDNVGDFQHSTAQMLISKFNNNTPITVYYDPSDPVDSVLIRAQRWEMIGFQLIFFVVFGSVGAIIIVLGARGKLKNHGAAVNGKLWLEKTEWSGNTIRSNARSSVYVMWGFAIFWNLVCLPLLFSFDTLVQKEGWLISFVLIFPLIGVGLVVNVLRLTFAWRRFGMTPLKMDPFPGVIGGDVGGEILVNLPYDPTMRCEVTLSCIHSYVSGSGKNRSRHESVHWQDHGYAKIIRAANRIRLQFKFNVPDNLPQSEEHSDNYNLWRLHIDAALPGSDLSRTFEIPVFKVPEKQSSITFDSPTYRPTGMAKLKALSLLPLVRSSGSTLELYYPMLRQALMNLTILIFGGFFAGMGGFLWTEAAREGVMLYAMASIFCLVGGGIMLAAIYGFFNSLRVRFDERTVEVTRKFLGFTLKQKVLDYRNISGISMQKSGTSTQSGGKHRIQYEVYAQSGQEKTVLAEQLESHSKAKLVAEYFQQLTGNRSAQTTSDYSASSRGSSFSVTT